MKSKVEARAYLIENQPARMLARMIVVFPKTSLNNIIEKVSSVTAVTCLFGFLETAAAADSFHTRYQY